MTCRE